MKIEKTNSQSHPQGEIQVFKLTNARGASVTLCNIGAGILSIEAPDRHGNLLDVALGYKQLESYFHDGPCMGKTPGRFANRIAKGRFSLNGNSYELPVNNGVNHLHGGPEGFANRIWKGNIEEEKVVFTLVSHDGDEGYPAQLRAQAAYAWNDRNELSITYLATADADTIINLTNHAYFNLAGENSGTVLEHTLQLHASHWLPTDDTLIPTGVIAPVKGTPMDFTEAKPLGKDIHACFDALKFGKGYDNCWVVQDWTPGKLQKIAVLHSEASGITLEVHSTQPGVQIYTGNWLSGSPESKSGRPYNDYEGVALECQGFPNAPNRPSFPPATLRKGECYRQTVVFKFTN